MFRTSFRTRSVALFTLIAAVAVFASVRFGPFAKADAEPAQPAFVPTITATNNDALVVDNDGDGRADPGDTLEYTVTVQNTAPVGAGNDATSMVYNSILSNDLTLVGGTINASPIAIDDAAYTATGNVRITVADGTGDLLGNDINPMTGTNAGLTVTTLAGDASLPFAGTSAQGGNVTSSASDGSFIYNPAPGFTGTDTFTYIVTGAGGTTATATVTFNVTGMIWFVQTGAAVGGDGRLTNPFNCYTGTNTAALTCFSATAADDPGDNIFLYTGAYTGGNTLLANQRLIGQGAGASLSTITGITPPAGSDALPATGGVRPTMTTTVAATSAVILGSGNTLRGFDIGNTTAFDIAGSSFGTLTVSELGMNGSGGLLNLSTGTLAATFGILVSSSSTSQGLILNAVGGTLTATGVSISNSTTQCLLVSGSTVTANFGGTTCAGGTDGISLQNNSAGTRTFVGLTVGGGTGSAFLHGAGGGNVSVTAFANLNSPLDAISVNAPGATNVITFSGSGGGGSGASAVCTTAACRGINWVGTAGATMTFNDLVIQTNAGIGLNATTGGTINVTNATATSTINATTQAAPAIVAANVALNANFASIRSSGGANGVSLTTVSGTSNFGGGALTGTATGATFLVSGGTVSTTYTGSITQAAAQPMVSVNSNHTTGTLTFNTGTLSATNGTGLQFDNADGTYNFNGTTTLNGGDAGIDIANGSAGSFTFASGTSINNPTGIAYREDTSAATVNYNGTVTKTNVASPANAVDINAKTAGTTTFSGAIAATTTTANAIDLTNTGGIVTFRGGMVVSTTSGVGFNATGAGTTVNVCDDNPCAAATGALVNTLTSTTGTALNVVNTTIGANNLEFRSISAGAGTNNGINLDTTGASGGLIVVGTGTAASGGTIANKAGANGNTTQGIGIYLNSTANVSLARMQLNDHQNFAIRASDVNGFSLQNSVINGNNGNDAGTDEEAIFFLNCSGTLTIANNSISGGFEDNIGVLYNSATADTAIYNVTTNAFTDLQSGNNALVKLTTTTAASAASNVTFNIGSSSTPALGNTFDNSANQNPLPPPATQWFGDGILVTFEGPFQHTINIDNNTFFELFQGIDYAAGFSADVNGRIYNNNITYTEGVGAIAFGTASTSTAGMLFQMLIEDNDIGGLGNDSGSRLGSGIVGDFRGAETSRITLHQNVVSDCEVNPINFISQMTTGGDGDTHIRMTNNTVSSIDDDAGGGAGVIPGINVTTNALTNGDIFLTIANNALTSINEDDILVRQATANNTYSLEDFAGNGTIAADVDAYLEAQNPGNTARVRTGGSVVAYSTMNFNNTNTPAPLTPIPPPGEERPGLAFLDENGVAGNDLLAILIAERPADVAKASVENGELRIENGESIANADFGMRNTESYPELIATGEFVPETIAPQPVLTATGEFAPAFKSQDPSPKPQVKESELGLLARVAELISPTVYSAETTPFSGETITVNGAGAGFTLPAGKTITIKYRATIDAPPPFLTVVTNQGTVSGGNFGPVLTDDPSIGGATDPTLTIVDSTTVAVSSSQNPSLIGQPVTFTATLTGAPSHGAADPGGTVEFFEDGNSLGAPVAVAAGALNDNTGTATLITSAIPSGSNVITAVFSGGGGFNANSSATAGGTNVTQVVGNTATWDGSASANWHDAANWTTNFAPLAAHDVVLPAGALPNSVPIISTATGDVTVNSLVISVGRALTITNSRTLTITTSMAMNGGNVDSGGAGQMGTLVIDDGATLTRTTGIINEPITIRKEFTAGARLGEKGEAPQAVFVFPVGTATGFSPLTANVTGDGSLAVKVNSGTIAPLADATTLDRYWTLTETGTLTADLTFQYLAGDVDGTEANYRLIRVTGGGSAVGTPNGTPCPGAGNPCVNTTADTIFAGAVLGFDFHWTAGVLAPPTAANVGVSGRVYTSQGRGVAGAMVRMTDQGGNTVYALTNPFGYYRFDGVPSGQDYVMTVTSKQHTFAARLVSVSDEITNLDFIAEAEK